MPPLSSIRPGLRATRVRSGPSLLPKFHVPLSAYVVDCAVYVDGVRLPGRFTHDRALAEVRRRDEGFVWIGLHEPAEEQITGIAEVFGLHELAVEDAVNAHQRPKLERYDDTLFMVLKTVRYCGARVQPGGRRDRRGHGLRRPRLRDLRPARRPLRAARRAPPPGGRPRAARARTGRGAARDRGPRRRRLPGRHRGDRGRHRRPRARGVHPAFRAGLRADLRDEARGAGAAPGGGPAGRAASASSPRATARWCRTRCARTSATSTTTWSTVTERIASFNELLTSLVDAALAKITMQQNGDMRKITSWVAIVSVPTMTAGIYGMNFDEMPALHWQLRLSDADGRHRGWPACCCSGCSGATSGCNAWPSG